MKIDFYLSTNFPFTMIEQNSFKYKSNYMFLLHNFPKPILHLIKKLKPFH